MKSLEYIKAFMEEKITAYEQVKANPGMYDKATKEYARVMKEAAIEWFNKASITPGYPVFTNKEKND